MAVPKHSKNELFSVLEAAMDSGSSLDIITLAPEDYLLHGSVLEYDDFGVSVQTMAYRVYVMYHAIERIIFNQKEQA